MSEHGVVVGIRGRWSLTINTKEIKKAKEIMANTSPLFYCLYKNRASIDLIITDHYEVDNVQYLFDCFDYKEVGRMSLSEHYNKLEMGVAEDWHELVSGIRYQLGEYEFEVISQLLLGYVIR